MEQPLARVAFAMLMLLVTSGCSASRGGVDDDNRSATVDDDRAVVSAPRAACRVRPMAKAKLVVSLSRGARLDVLERVGGWAKVRPTGDDCWVALSQLGTAEPVDPLIAADAAPTARRRYAPSSRIRRTYARRLHSPHARTLIDYGDGSCPCGSGHICIGPRGGRYCITSGGNKRYGM